jgi:MarR family 2-MHQ and catechol resistance regulon transcriptional repressor
MDMKRSGRIADSLVSLIRIFHVMRDYGEKSGLKMLPLDPQFAALGLLSKEDLTMSELGRRLERSGPNMTAIVSGMIKGGAVRRLPDRKDRRIVRISLTRKGVRLLEEKKRAVRGRIAMNLSRLSDADLETLCESLEKINSITSKIYG